MMATPLKRIYLSPPHIGEQEQALVQEALASNWIAPLGPHVEAFERELARYAGTSGAVALNSGTAALHLALRVLGVGPEDVVFCSTLTFVASANPILYQGAQPVFIDSTPDSWNMSPAALERAFTDAERRGRLPKAVIVVNLFGQSADLEPLLASCARRGVPVIEDAAESLGATYKGRPSGACGTLGVYSFNGNKIITTSGGGMLISHDRSLLEQARVLAAQARDPAIHYEHSRLGYNYRLSNVLAALGRAQLQVLEQRIKARRAVFERYVEALSSLPGIEFMPEAPYGRSTRWLTALTVDPDKTGGVSAHHLLEALSMRNIEARPVWKPMHRQPLFQHGDYYPHQPDYSVSDRIFACGLCLPSGSSLTEEDQERVIACINRVSARPG